MNAKSCSISTSLRFLRIRPRHNSTYRTWPERSTSDVYARSPAAISPAKLLPPEQYWWANVPAQEHDNLGTLLRAVQTRSPDKILEHLDMMVETNRAHLVGPVHLELIIRAMRPPDHFGDTQIKNKQRTYKRRMKSIRKFIRNSRIAVSRDCYVLLLEEARHLKPEKGNQLADEIWADMLGAGIVPDTHCYNSYIAATCVQPSVLDHLELRRKRKDNRRRAGMLEQAEMLGQKAVAIYQQMYRKGIQPNSMTIELLILALGSHGNLSTLKSIILKTWNIVLPEASFNALDDQGVPDEYEDEDLDMTDKTNTDVDIPIVDRESHLYPTQKTLIAIAAAFGSCQQNGLGLYTVRTVAKVYNMTISTNVWTELMKWSAADSDQLDGFTPRAHVAETLQLAETTYQTIPSISMYSVAIRHELASMREPSAAYSFFDRMLTSVQGRKEIPRATFKKNERVPHARQVAIRALSRMERNLKSPIQRLERKLIVAERKGGVDEMRLVADDLERRLLHLDKTLAQWTQRIREFDSRTQNWGSGTLDGKDRRRPPTQEHKEEEPAVGSSSM